MLVAATAAAGLRLVVGAGHDGEPYANAPHVAVLGHVTDDDLGALYRGAHAFAYASDYEGFGLPLLEAMAHDAPVVASDIAVFREAAETAATFVPVGDADAFARAFTALDDPERRARAIEAGRLRIGAMTWSATAEATPGIEAPAGDRRLVP